MNNISSNSGSPASRSSNHSSVRNLGYSSHWRSSSQSNTRQQASTNRAYAPTSDRFDSDGYQRFVNSTGLSRISSSRNNEPDMTDNSTYAIAEWARRTRQDTIRTHAPSSLYRNSLSAQIYEDSTAQSRNPSSRSEAAEVDNLIFEWASQVRQMLYRYSESLAGYDGGGHRLSYITRKKNVCSVLCPS